MCVRLAVTVAAVLAFGCSSGSKGDPGPAGPSGPKGDVGTSIVASSLAPGDTNCPAGGSQFVSASGTTYACNGAAGTGRVVVDATQAVVGQLLGADFVEAMVLRDGMMWRVNLSTGVVSTATAVLYFADDACAGPAVYTGDLLPRQTPIGSSVPGDPAYRIVGPEVILHVRSYKTPSTPCSGVDYPYAPSLPLEAFATIPQPFAAPLRIQ